MSLDFLSLSFMPAGLKALEKMLDPKNDGVLLRPELGPAKNDE